MSNMILFLPELIPGNIPLIIKWIMYVLLWKFFKFVIWGTPNWAIIIFMWLSTQWNVQLQSFPQSTKSSPFLNFVCIIYLFFISLVLYLVHKHVSIHPCICLHICSISSPIKKKLWFKISNGSFNWVIEILMTISGWFVYNLVHCFEQDLHIE